MAPWLKALGIKPGDSVIPEAHTVGELMLDMNSLRSTCALWNPVVHNVDINIQCCAIHTTEMTSLGGLLLNYYFVLLLQVSFFILLNKINPFFFTSPVSETGQYNVKVRYLVRILSFYETISLTS